MEPMLLLLLLLLTLLVFRGGVVFVSAGGKHGAGHHDRVLRYHELTHHAVLNQQHLIIVFLAVRLGSVRLVLDSNDELVLVRFEIAVVEEKEAQDGDTVPEK